MSGCFLCSPNASRTSRKTEVSRPVMTWYGLSIFHASSFALIPPFFLVLCVCDTLLSSLIIVCLSPSSFFRWKCLLPWLVGFWRKRRLQPFLFAFPGMEEEVPSGGMAKETG